MFFNLFTICTKRTREALKTLLKHVTFKTLTVTVHFHSCNHRKWLPCQILGGKLIKNVQIDQQTTEMWPKQLNVTLSLSKRGSERVCE